MKTEKKDTKKIKTLVQQEEKPSKMRAIAAFFKSEALQFIMGLALVLVSAFAIYAFVQYFFTGGADQSVVQSVASQQVSADESEVENATGIRGAQLAEFFMNYFGAPTLLLALFFLVTGLKMMHMVKVRLWKWFFGCTLLMIWLSVFFGFIFKGLYEDSFFYFGGLHGFNISNWLEQQVGVPGLLMILFFTAICLLVYFSTQTVIWFRKAFSPSNWRRKKKEEPTIGEPDGKQHGKEQAEAQTNNKEQIDDTKTDPIDLGGPDDDTFTVVAPKDGDEGLSDDDDFLDNKYRGNSFSTISLCLNGNC